MTGSSPHARSTSMVNSRGVLPLFVIFVNTLPLVAEQVACSSGIKGDFTYRACSAFCKQTHLTAHCRFCKCQGCAFCSGGGSGTPRNPSSRSEGTASPKKQRTKKKTPKEPPPQAAVHMPPPSTTVLSSKLQGHPLRPNSQAPNASASTTKGPTLANPPAPGVSDSHPNRVWLLWTGNLVLLGLVCYALRATKPWGSLSHRAPFANSGEPGYKWGR